MNILLHTELNSTLFGMSFCVNFLFWKSRESMCWLPYPQNHITGNALYGTGNATHTGAVIFKGDVTGTSAAKAGSPYPQTYFTGIAPKYDVQYR